VLGMRRGGDAPEPAGKRVVYGVHRWVDNSQHAFRCTGETGVLTYSLFIGYNVALR
jgi:hypothetical protein